MTTTAQDPYNLHTANGVSTAFAYEFRILVASHMVVKVDGDTIPDSEYTLSGVGDANGGTVTFDVAPAADAEVLLARVIPLTRSVNYTTNGPFPASTVNIDFDLIWMVLQGIAADFEGVLRVPFPNEVDDIPSEDDRAGRLLGFHAGTAQPVASVFTMAEVVAALLQITTNTANIASNTSSIAALAAVDARTIRLPDGETAATLGPVSSRQDRLLAFNSSSGAPEMSSFTMTQVESTIAAAYEGAAGPLDALSFIQGGTGAVSRTAQNKAREVVSVTDFAADGVSGARVVADGATDCTAGINAAATYARSIGAALLIPPTASFYLISSQVDLTGIRHIDGRNALIKPSANEAYAALKIGYRAVGAIPGVLENYGIWLETWNFTDGSTTDGNVGIQVEGLRSGTFVHFVRGFDEGVYFNGADAVSTNWVDNHFHPLQMYNNGSHYHLDLGDESYFNSNQFHGGLYYLGTGSKKSGRAPFKITHGGTTSVQVHANTVHDPCINVDGGSYHADNALLLYLENTALGVFNSFSFRNVRYESNNLGAFATDPYLVNIAVNTNSASKYEIDIELLSGVQRWLLNLGGDQKANSIYVRTAANWSMGGNMARQRIVNRPMFPYQIDGKVYVPGRTLYDTTLTAVASSITNGVAARTTQARGDGTLVTAGSTVIVGKRYKRSVSAQSLHLLLPDSTTLTVIAYDAAGAVLTGTAPWYIRMTSDRNAAFGGVNVYQGASNWIWIHPDVDSVFIGAGPWTAAARRIPDIHSLIEVLYGDNLIPVNDDDTGPNIHGASANIQSYFPVGMAIDGDASNGWRCTFALRTTNTSARVATDTTIDLTSVVGMNAGGGDRIGIEVDTVITGTVRQIHWADTSAVAGSTVTFSPALPAGVAIGRTVYVNRWVAR